MSEVTPTNPKASPKPPDQITYISYRPPPKIDVERDKLVFIELLLSYYQQPLVPKGKTKDQELHSTDGLSKLRKAWFADVTASLDFLIQEGIIVDQKLIAKISDYKRKILISEGGKSPRWTKIVDIQEADQLILEALTNLGYDVTQLAVREY